MDTTSLAHVPILVILLSAYRSLTEAEWEPIAETRIDLHNDGSLPVWRMRRWRNGRYEYRDCTTEEAQEADWDRAMK